MGLLFFWRYEIYRLGMEFILCRRLQLGGGWFGVGLRSRDRGNFGDGNFGGGNFDIYIWFGKWNRWFRVGLSSTDRGNIGALSRFPTNKTRGLRR